jgi:hypothetical protein
MTPTQLAMVVEFARRDEQQSPDTETQAYSFMPEIEAGRVKEGQKVVFRWRRSDLVGHFIKRDGDRVLVLDNGKKRRCRADLVRYPKDGEFPDSPDNINASEDAQ